ncbi:hypothetical protein [Acinetobacter guillouiae]|uniref:hypothetical protein n=1 Tax=Acinetobacter guillouiae TaxID=106649 RepID=UPI00125058E5|nr:hypothetical protein [Acinetobacter guillouiae]
MKIIQTLLMLLALSSTAFAETQNIQINQNNFELKTVMNEDEADFLRKDIELYRNNQKLLTHTIYSTTGDCSILQIELGDYEVKDNKIIFYSYWASGDRQGLWTYPYGVRKQTYTVDAKGKVKLVSAVLYVEDILGDPLSTNPDEEYLQFLHTAPKTKQHQRALNEYIQTMQSDYKGRFVHGQERARLIQEVKSKLAKQIATETKGWKEQFGTNVRM